MNLRRAFVALMIITLTMTVLMVQLFLIQLIHYDRYSARRVDLTARSVMQRARSIVLDDGRGRIVDRAGRHLTSFHAHALLIEPHKAFPWLDQQPEALRKLLSTLNMTQEQWERYRNSSATLFIAENDAQPMLLSREQSEKITREQIPGVEIVPYVLRYKPPYTAAHVIGYVSQDPFRLQQLYADELASGSMQLSAKLGASGLERSFEKLLRSRGQLSVNTYMDAVGRPLSGLDRRWMAQGGPYYPLQVVTTLDLQLQQRIEQLLDERNIKQASIVLLDPSNADVLAMANRPNYSPEHPDPNRTEWRNLAIQQQIPGSIFKIVVAAAALEYGVAAPREKFVCNGEYGKYGFSCWKKDGHGHLTFEEAFAASCNITFAELAKRLTAEQLQHTANMLGIGRPIGWESVVSTNRSAGEVFRQFDAEEAGRVFAANSVIDEGVMVQSAIGQRDVRMTPLQAANLMVTILNDGVLMSPRLVSEVRYKDGGIKERYGVHRFKWGGVSRATARTLQRFMRETVKSGTATRLNKHDWPLAGKTGTAQLASHPSLVNEWFVGYGPSERPRIAAAVVIYNVQDDGRNHAAELFAEVMDIVRSLHRQG